MTEVTRNSAMVREPTTIHTTTTTATSTADESSSSTTHLASPTSESQQEISIMPDLSETKLHNSRNPNNRTPAGELRHKHAGHHSSGDEGTHDEEDKHDGNDEVPSNNNEDSTNISMKNNSSSVNNSNNSSFAWSHQLHQASSELSGEVKDLQDDITRLTKERDRLKRESEDYTKTIAKLQMQLQQQSDYELLKREVQLLKGVSPKVGPPSSSLTPPPPIPPPLTSMANSGPTSSLELLLVERAKALQQANPALKAFADMQGASGNSNFPGLGAPPGGRHPLFPGAPPGLDPAALGLLNKSGLDPAALGLMSEEMLAQWRTLGAGLGLPGAPPLTPPNTSSGSTTDKIPSSPGPLDHPAPSETPTNGRVASPNGPPDGDDPVNRETPTLTNGGDGSKTHSEPRDVGSPGDMGSPGSRADESKSPQKLDDILSPSVLNLSTPSASQLTASMASHFPPLNNPISLSLPLPLSVPPLMSTGRIPKSDPMEGKLQDMLRYNMEKFAGQPLDTLGMSRRVRELLSIHNIGQRLFAKYVLGLSQGTVSELLSKPKSWDKLTEKGRDSYRKMHAWCYDENAVMLLKSLIPRKGELMRPVSQAPPPLPAPHLTMMKEDRPNPTTLGPSGFPYGQNGNEERIAKILSEANKAMAAGVAASAASKDNATSLPAVTSSGSTLATTNTTEGETPQERMSKLYQEELSRLMQSQQRARLQGGGGADKPPVAPELPGLPGLFPGLAGGLFQRAQQSDLQRAMDVYQQEFNRLHQNALAAAFRAQQNGGSKDEDTKSETPHPPESPAPSSGDTKSPGARQESPIGKGPGSGLFPAGDMDLVGSLSPLQRMASITNSLVSQPSLPGQPNSANRPNRACLPPITQQQFDRFSHLNTDEVVRRVKDILSQYSISQRLFGESVLGLSQGSVSDLLARPKPWHMLTQKGREPFIRMKLFLDDENAVHKLVASQYKIAPEKLMRTGSYGGGSPYGQAPKPNMPKLPDFPRSLPESPMLPSSLRFGGQESLLDRPPPMLDPLLLHKKLLSQKMGPAAVLGGPSAALGGPPSQSLYEMAALTHEMDTQAVTTKVKEILLANNVGQKHFGEHVLGLSQGSVSELLSKPKPWHMLSIKGREPFIRMQLWLNDPTNVEKLQAMKAAKDSAIASGKRKRSFPGGPGSGMGDSGSDRSSPAADTPGDPYSADSPGSASAKKPRVYFTEEQKEALKIAFALDPYPSQSSMEFLSQELGLETRSISNWFHNHRMRLKQQLPQGMDNLLANREGGQSTFDPVKFRLLMHQRMLEMQSPEEAAANSSSVTSLLRQFSSFQHHSGSNPGSPLTSSGLDLSYKRDGEDDDKDSIAESARSGDDREDENSNNHSETGGHVTPVTQSIMGISSSGGGGSGSRSRRKPAAPQWVRPEWNKVDATDSAEGGPAPGVAGTAATSSAGGVVPPSTLEGGSKSDLTINGVCVMNAGFRASFNKSEDEDRPDQHSGTASLSSEVNEDN